MLNLGQRQKLKIARKSEIGVYLVEPEATDLSQRILLPKKSVPEGVKIGDEVEVFIYKDSQDRSIATTAEAKISLNEVAALGVKEVSKIGAFLDWGLEKDLFLPFKEMSRKVNAGDEILVRLYIDKSGRLAASTKGIYKLLSI